MIQGQLRAHSSCYMTYIEILREGYIYIHTLSARRPLPLYSRLICLCSTTVESIVTVVNRLCDLCLTHMCASEKAEGNSSFAKMCY